MSEGNPFPEKMFYGRRIGRPLSPQKSLILGEVLGKITFTGDISPCSKTWMEVGMGYGDHLLQRLAETPQDHFIASEVFQNGLAYFCAHLASEDFDRVRIFPGNVHDMLPLIPDNSITGIYILFPDPWPKKSHIKRRMMSVTFLKICHRMLVPEGCVYFASDHENLVAWTLEQFLQSGVFECIEGTSSSDPQCWEEWKWPHTRYERKATALGRPCAFNVWRAKT